MFFSLQEFGLNDSLYQYLWSKGVTSRHEQIKLCSSSPKRHEKIGKETFGGGFLGANLPLQITLSACMSVLSEMTVSSLATCRFSEPFFLSVSISIERKPSPPKRGLRY